MGHDILPPGYLDEASRILGSPSRLDSLAQSTLVDFQVLIGSSGMREYKSLKLHLLGGDRMAARRYQEAIWQRTGTAFLVAMTADGRVLEYASPPSARRQPRPGDSARDLCRQQAAVPLLIDGVIQCTVVVGAFLREMLELAPDWLYMNCTKDPGDLEKAGNAAAFISALGWTKSGLVYVPHRKDDSIVYTGQDQDEEALRISAIVPEVGLHSGSYGSLSGAYEDAILPRFAGMMAAYDVPVERISLMGSIEAPDIRAHVGREMRLSRRLPVVMESGTVVRRHPDGKLEEGEWRAAKTLRKRVSEAAAAATQRAAPSCTIGKPCRTGATAVQPG